MNELALLVQDSGPQGIHGLGWLFLIVSVGFVTILTFWCFKKVLGLPPEEKDSVKDLHSA